MVVDLRDDRPELEGLENQVVPVDEVVDSLHALGDQEPDADPEEEGQVACQDEGGLGEVAAVFPEEVSQNYQREAAFQSEERSVGRTALEEAWQLWELEVGQRGEGQHSEAWCDRLAVAVRDRTETEGNLGLE